MGPVGEHSVRKKRTFIVEAVDDFFPVLVDIDGETGDGAGESSFFSALGEGEDGDDAVCGWEHTIQ